MPKQADEFRLPSTFRFCVSTAAHQIEGYNSNSDWYDFERVPGHIKEGHTADIATDSWSHVDEDIQNLKTLGVDTYRFSLEWAKIEPRENEFNNQELSRYLQFIDRLKSEGIEPMVTLYHFTLPLWVSMQGGWEWEGITQAFDRFVRHVASRVGTRVKIWNTINEPMTLISAGYVSDVFPPGKKDVRSIGIPMRNMIQAHARAYHSLHEILDTKTFQVQVGMAHHLRIFDPRHSLSPLDYFLARTFDQVFNWAIPRALRTGRLKFHAPFLARADYFIPEAAGTADFFGLNYYSRDLIGFNLFEKEHLVRTNARGVALTDLNWEIYPEGMNRLIEVIKKEFPELPIWITENGLADQSDEKRMPFIKSHLQVLAKQIASGANIEGYCHWTLNDNFEWAEGYTAHFGFYSLEPGTLKRIARPSVKAFADLIRKVRA